jgi:hypothetical protein
MIDRERQPDNDPEVDNAEQDDEPEQTHTIAEEALRGGARAASPLDSEKVPSGEIDDDSTQDLIDHMRDMEQSGRIDMSAFEGEENHDDNEDKYGDAARIDDYPSDGS